MMLVYTRVDMDSGIVDEAVITADKARGTAEDPAVQGLLLHYESKDVDALMATVFDEGAHYKVRMKAAELVGELGSVETVDALSSYQFKDQRISAAVRDAISRIHAINATLECPFCSEIVQAGIVICSQCGRKLD
jgi:hypothetical protein